MRKAVSVILAAALILSVFAACGEEGETSTTAATTKGNTVTGTPTENTASSRPDMEPTEPATQPTEPATEPTEPATEDSGVIDLPDIPW